MLWLFDDTGAQSAYLAREKGPSSVVTKRRFASHSEIAAQLPLVAYADAAAAEYVELQGRPEVYLVEHVSNIRKRMRGSREQYVDMRGREASALLHTRTLEGTFSWVDVAPGQMIKDILDSFTGDRAIDLVFGTGETLGTPLTMQRSWKDAGEVVLEILALSGLGMTTRMNGSTPTLDIVEAGTTATLMGDKHGSGSASEYTTSKASWRNYAIVLGQGLGEARTRVDVDLTGSEERRELTVDADDLDPGDFSTAADYQAALAGRGTAALAETRKVAYGEATLEDDLEPGSLVYYDAGDWSTEAIASEVEETREGGKRSFVVTLGQGRGSMSSAIARIARGSADIRGGNVHSVGAVGEPAFANSWVNFGGSNGPAQFVKDSTGRVQATGVIKSGTVGDVTAFTLPVGYRPPYLRSFIVNAGGSPGVVSVGTDGAVKVQSGSNAYVHLDAVGFHTA